jgi:uncharacterized membrane protein YphA (DoxX/SURF4 family)
MVRYVMPGNLAQFFWISQDIIWSSRENGRMALFPSDSTSASGPVSLALLIVRIATALPFLYHGSAILFGAFGGPGPHGFASSLNAPDIVGYLVGLAQFGGGLAILTGILIRFGALCIVIVMLSAIFMVHLALTSAKKAMNTRLLSV